jgi:hypothetical protein
MPKIKKIRSRAKKINKILTSCTFCSVRAESKITELDHISLLFPQSTKKLCIKHLKKEVEDCIDDNISFKIEFIINN